MNSPAVVCRLGRPVSLVSERADVAAVMALVWSLARSGPNFDGRQVAVRRAVADAIDAAVDADRERICEALPGGHSVDPQWVADMVRAGPNGAERGQ